MNIRDPGYQVFDHLFYGGEDIYCLTITLLILRIIKQRPSIAAHALQAGIPWSTSGYFVNAQINKAANIVIIWGSWQMLRTFRTISASINAAPQIEDWPTHSRDIAAPTAESGHNPWSSM